MRVRMSTMVVVLFSMAAACGADPLDATPAEAPPEAAHTEAPSLGDAVARVERGDAADPSLRDAIIAGLADEGDVTMTVRGIAALGAFPGDVTTAYLTARLKAEPDGAIAHGVMYTLARVGDGRVAPALEAQVSPRDPARAAVALGALKQIADRAGDKALAAKTAALLDATLRAPDLADPVQLLFIAPLVLGTTLPVEIDRVDRAGFSFAVRARARVMAQQIADHRDERHDACEFEPAHAMKD